MERRIVGFRTDDDGDWVALLDCGHPQHVRHRPPFINRPWAATETGRRDQLGKSLNCVRCDRLEIPEGYVLEGASPSSALPEILRDGMWGIVRMSSGSARFTLPALNVDTTLTTTTPGILPPDVSYTLNVMAGSEFFMEFYKPAV